MIGIIVAMPCRLSYMGCFFNYMNSNELISKAMHKKGDPLIARVIPEDPFK